MILTVLDKKLKKHEKAWDSTGTDSLNGGGQRIFLDFHKTGACSSTIPCREIIKIRFGGSTLYGA